MKIVNEDEKIVKSQDDWSQYGFGLKKTLTELVSFLFAKNGKIKKDIREILHTLCERKGIQIIEATACKDHVHMLVSVLSKLSVSAFVGYLKEKVVWMIFDRHANLKYRYGNRKFWCTGYYVDTVERSKKGIEEYI